MKHKFYYLLGSLLNNIISYITYYISILFINYNFAYLLAYFVGLVVSYVYNSKIVFKASINIKNASLFPLVYVLQYILSALLLRIGVEYFEINEKFAPLIISAIMLPVTYLFTKLIFLKFDSKSICVDIE